MTERAEGFWWVRWEGEADEVAEVVSWAEHARRLGWSFDVPDAPAQMLRSRLGWTSVKTVGIEWGPYLGKAPDLAIPQHTEECGIAFRGCSPSCTFERDYEARRLARGR